MNIKVLIVGSGLMTMEYVKVLESLSVDFDVVGRSEVSVAAFAEKTGHNAISGGLDDFLRTTGAEGYTHFVVATNVMCLFDNVMSLLQAGAKNILVEKPCVLDGSQLDDLLNCTLEKDAKVFIAYNRRFFSSVKKAKELVEQDGGLEMVKFDFTEWAHVIEKLEKEPLEKERWLLSNSSHIIDLAFYFSGQPKELSVYVAGQLDWHPSGKVFAGAGISEKGVVISYGSDWGSAGRWWLELFTSKRKLRLCPIEQLKETLKGTIVETIVDLEDDLDCRFKPGLYSQVQAFFEPDNSVLKTVQELSASFHFFSRIAGYPEDD